MNIKRYIKTEKIIIYFLILFILILLILFYIFDLKKIGVQRYLKKIYYNTILLKQKFHTLINNNYEFKKENNLYIIHNFLNPKFHDFLKDQFYDKDYASNNAIYRKGSGINFFNLHDNNNYHGFLELYYSMDILNVLSNIFQKSIQRTPLSDDNACSLLIYTKKGDYIDWHKDYSLYYGDRYVVLLTIINENSTKDDLSENKFCYMYNNQEYQIKLAPNTLVIFKGSDVYHKSTPINTNELRILLSMTFCDICQEKKNILNFSYEKMKNLIIYN